jgi:hypothetical protein
VSGLARVDRADLVSNKKAAAIAEILKMRDQLVVMRERLFQLTAATAVRTKEVDGLLIDCAGAGRVFGVPDWQMCLGGRQTLKRHTSPSARRLKRTIPWRTLPSRTTLFLPMRPGMPMPRRVVERATREHGRIEDRHGPQRRAELTGPAPSNIVSPTNERIVRKTDVVGSRAVSHARRRTRTPGPCRAIRRSATARPRDRSLSVIGKAVRPAKNRSGLPARTR